MRHSHSWLRPTGPVLPLLLAALVTLPLLGARDLWAPDEPRYAQVAQEMLADGHWWYPHVNSRPYADKPPLYFWLAAAAGAMSGHVTEGASRLPSALAHLLLVALTWHLGRRLWDERAGAVAAAALATTWLQAWMARRACLDVLLSLCAAGAIAAALAAGDAARAGRRRRATTFALLAGVATGLGVMTKGPVILVTVGAAGLALLLHPGVRASRPPRWATRGIAIAALALGVTLAAWLIPARVLGGYDPLSVTKEHVIDRATEGRHHEQPPWYFLGQAPVDLLPWTLLLVPAAAWAWRRRQQWPEAVLLTWAGVPVVLHSVIVEKRNIYLLPIAPACALLCGAWVAAQGEAASVGLRRASAIAAVLLGVLGILALAAAAPLLFRLPEDAAEALALPGVRGGVAGIGLAAILGLALILHERRRGATPLRHAGALAVAFGAVFLGIALLLPRLDSLKSGRSMGAAVQRLPSAAPIAMFPVTKDAYVYYSGRSFADLGDPAGARAWLARVGRPAYVLAHEADVPALPDDGATSARSVFADAVGHRVVHLLRYETPPESP